MQNFAYYFISLFCLSSCLLNNQLESVYIQPASLQNIYPDYFTIGTSSQIYKLSPFSVGKFEVTFEEWRSTYDWAKNNGYTFDNTGRCGTLEIKTGNYTEEQGKLPVTRISWGDAIIWCNAKSQMEGLSPVYTMPNGDIAKDSAAQDDDYNFLFLSAKMNIKKNGYRLPTLVEWQYLAQGGSVVKTAYAGTNDVNELEDYAWIYSNAQKIIQTVGTKKPNALGIYDMSGNADEWVWDFSNGNKVDTTVKITINGKEQNVYVNPIGPSYSSDKGSAKKVMGGNVNCGNTTSNDLGERTTDSCKITYIQRGALPSLYEPFGGFRICRTLGD